MQELDWRLWLFAAGAAFWGALVLRRLWRWPGIARRPWHLRLRLYDVALVVVLFLVTEQLSQLAVWVLGVYWPKLDAERPIVIFFRMSVLHALNVLLIPAALAWSGQVRVHQLGLHRKRLGKVLAFGLMQLLVWWPVVAAINIGVRTHAPERTPHPAERLLKGSLTFGEWAVLTFSVVVAAPIGEELLFRGILQAWLGRHLRPPLAIVAAALAFGLVHTVTWPDPVPLTVLGIGLGLTYYRTQSLWAPAALHGAFNGLMLFVGYLTMNG